MPKKRQTALGAFVDGMGAKEVDYDLLERQKKRVKYDFSSGSSYAPRVPHEVFPTAEEEGVYSYNDMVNSALKVVWSLNGLRILVCPLCKRDTVLVKPEYFETCNRSDDKVLFDIRSSFEVSSFAECPACKTRFFLPELVASRSFRLPLPAENVNEYFPYLSCVFLLGEWRVLIGRAVEDVGEKATGKTWIE